MGIQNVLGVNYPYPDPNDKPWGIEQINWSTAVSNAINAHQTSIDNLQDDVTTLQTQVTTIEGEIGNAIETAENVGSGQGILLPVVSNNLPAKSLIAGSNIVLTPSADSITITTTATGTGNVMGPASSIDSNIAVFDGITGKKIKDGGISIAGILALIPSLSPNYQLSNSCGVFLTSSTTSVAVTNLSVTITTTGGPVILAVIGDNSVNRSYFSVQPSSSTGTNASLDLYVFKDGTQISRTWMAMDVGGSTAELDLYASNSTPITLDFPTAGTYTYSIRAGTGNTSDIGGVRYKKLLAYELR